MPELALQDVVTLHGRYLAQSYPLHYEQNPMKIVKANFQHVYDNTGQEFLDCASAVALVGHCHPEVTAAGLTHLQTASLPDLAINSDYPDKLLATLPSHLTKCFFANSGSEANDLAIQLARAATQRKDVLVIDHSFHGNLGLLSEVSPRIFRRCSRGKNDWVHVIPLPDVYRGRYKTRDDKDAIHKYILDAKRVMEQALLNGRQISCFISEPIMTTSGVIVPDKEFLQQVYSVVHELGGLCIADEAQTGLGRNGSHFWGFQAQGILPDIVTIGKPLGNGYPMAAVITTEHVANFIPTDKETFSVNSLSSAVGSAVLQIIHKEKLITNAGRIGTFLMTHLLHLKEKHQVIGDVRGCGLIVGVELVIDQQSRKPATELAEYVVGRMRLEHIILGNDGPDKNVLVLLPPLCFTEDDASSVVHVLDQVLTRIHAEQLEPQPAPSADQVTLTTLIRSNEQFEKEEKEESMEPPAKKQRMYDEMD